MIVARPREGRLISWPVARIACSLLGCPGTVLAHSVFQGVGNFYGGFLHPAGVPAHLLALLAVGLFVGQRGWEFTVHALRLFILSCLGGLALAWTGVKLPAILPLLTGAAVLGVLVAAGLRVPPKAGLALAVWVGFFIALDSAPDGLEGAARLAALGGTALGASAAFIWVSAPVSALGRPWQHIAIRAAGSWVGASALLVLALAATGRPMSAF